MISRLGVRGLPTSLFEVRQEVDAALGDHPRLVVARIETELCPRRQQPVDLYRQAPVVFLGRDRYLLSPLRLGNGSRLTIGRNDSTLRERSLKRCRCRSSVSKDGCVHAAALPDQGEQEVLR